MSRPEWMTVAAGPALDRAVAELVLGGRIAQAPGGGWFLVDGNGTTWENPANAWLHGGLPAYSQAIAHAWEVVEAMRSRGYGLHLASDGGTEHRFCAARFDAGLALDPDPDAEAIAPTAPLAICQAALAALPAPPPTPG